MKPMPPARVKVPFLWPLIVSLTCWLLIAFACTSCQPGASLDIPSLTVEGNFATYRYSSKGGLYVKPRTTVIDIRDEK